MSVELASDLACRDIHNYIPNIFCLFLFRMPLSALVPCGSGVSCFSWAKEYRPMAGPPNENTVVKERNKCDYIYAAS